MGAAWYVGRVGGLAVALGAGAAILTGTGVASADTGDGSSTTRSSSSSSEQSPSTEPRARTSRSAAAKSAAGAEADGPRSGSRPTGTVSAQSVVKRASPEEAETTAVVTTTAVTERFSEQSSIPATPENPDTPDEWALLAAARRDLAAEPSDYSPVIGVKDGVITGTNTGSTVTVGQNPLSYNVVGGPTAGGKVNLDTKTGDFTFLPYSTQLTAGGFEQFNVLVAEKTRFVMALEQISIVKYFVAPVLVRLHQVPILNDVLAPVIGRSAVVTVGVPVGDFVGDGRPPIAFTTTVTSFDGTPISVNYFPKLGLQQGEQAPTLLNGPSLATAGYTDPNQQATVVGLVPGLAQLRAAGYNVVTWDPRGEFASGGRLHLDSENFEARDVSAIISWVAEQPGTRLEPNSDDPYLGMVGGSYGGGIQLTSAGIDPRIDAIAPGIAWNSLLTALYPNHAFKTSWASLLLLSLVASESRLDPQIYAGILTGVIFGVLTPGQQKFLSSNSPATVVDQINVPTLFLQGTVDGLFTLQQALDNAEALEARVPVKMIWYCGGHGACLDPVDLDAQSVYLTGETLAWMNTYVMNKGKEPGDTGPTFTWVDQKGDWYSADELPLPGSGFFGTPIGISGDGGIVPIVPILGGSGPQWKAPFPVSLTLAAPARHALDVKVALPESDTPTYIVGAPELTLTYSGLGTSRNVYAQLVDTTTGRVVGNLVTPIPVTLNGQTHTVTIAMENIAYTAHPGEEDALVLQIVDSASAYEDFTSFGVIRVSHVGLTLPTAQDVTPRTVPAPARPAGIPAEAHTLEHLLLGVPPR